MIFNIILVIVICVATTYFVLDHRRRLPLIKAGNTLPGPKAYPLIGNAHYFLQRNFNEFLAVISMIMKTYPSLCRFWMGKNLFIFITNPEHAKIVLQSHSCLDKSIVYESFESVSGMGIFTAPAHLWTAQRKMIAPSFNANLMRDLLDIIVEKSLIFVDELGKIELNGKQIDLHHHLYMCTLNIIFGTMLGVTLESQSNKNRQFIEAFMRFKKLAIYRIQNVFLYPDILYNLSSTGREQRKIFNVINSIADEVIQKKADMLKNQNTAENENAKTSKKIFLDILMEMLYDESHDKKRFTQEYVRDEIKTMVAAGSDTTPIAMNFVIFMLANFPEIQEKVYRELLEIYGTQDPKTVRIKYEDLQYMAYLERVIKETMRIFPVVPIIARHLTQDLKIDGFTLPKGAEILVGILHLHRDEKHWPNPLTFDPDRFLPENIADRHSYCYLPFSNGPRNCLGMKYGMMSMKTVLATLVRTFVFKVDKKIKLDQIKISMNMMLTTVEPLKIRIGKRNFQQYNVKMY